MKTIEEKAKAYDEAIRKLRGMMPNWERLSYNGKTFLQDLIYIIPELAESEDEKVRKALLEMVHDTTGDELLVDYGVHKEEALAWVEKQGEKLPAGFYYVNSEGKKFYSDTFKYGDVILHVEKQGADSTVLSNSSNIGKDEQKHKYNIGDIITNGKVTYRVDKIVKNCLGKDSYFLVDIEVEKNWPQEPDFIDSKRKRFNYGEITWLCDQVDKSFRKIDEQKPVEENKGNVGGISSNWSEEDEEQVSIITNIVKAHCGKLIDCRSNLSWLQSLKGRVKPQWKPSDVQIECLSDAIEHYNSLGYPASKLKELLDDLKKLKEEQV